MSRGNTDRTERFSERVERIEGSATIHFGNIAGELRAGGADVIGMGGGSPDFETPEHVREAAVDAVERDENQLTTTRGLPALREAIADRLRELNGIDAAAERVIVTPGSKFSLYEAMIALLDEGDEAVLLDPSWVTYEAIVGMAGGELNRVTLDPATGFSPGSVDLAAAVSDDTRLLIVNNPSNPAGAVFSRDELAEIRDLAIDHDFWVIADEIYDRMVHDGEHVSVASLDGMADRTVTTNGFSKSYAMSGWRLGYFTAPEPLLEQATKVQSNTVSCPTTLVQHAGLAALEGPQEPVAEMRRTFEERIDAAVDVLADRGVDVPKPRGAFYLFVPAGTTDDVELCEELLYEEHVSTVPGSAFGVPGYVRLALTVDVEEIEEGVRRIAPYLGR